MSLRRAAAAALMVVAGAAAHAQPVVLINEGFNNVATLPASGWILANASTPLGSTGWFQGLPAASGFFDAQSGAANSYIAANFNNAAPGGTIANWLMSPSFTTEVAGSVTFWARAAQDEGFADHLAFGLSNGGSGFGDFTLGAAQTIGGDWTQFTVNYTAHGAGATGRFAIEYVGLGDASNYVGVDTFAVTAAVPEPETWALMMLGRASLGAVASRRKSQK
jgi:PEP-CTERM putative exosortase interaction domain